MSEVFQCDFEVRDNETDLQGIVNNANYFIYMGHARHKHLHALGVDFAKLSSEGFDFVLIHTDISFKGSLLPGDEFIVTSKINANGRIRIDFVQEVIRKSDNKVVTTAINTGTCIDRNSGRPKIPDNIRTLLGI